MTTESPKLKLCFFFDEVDIRARAERWSPDNLLAHFLPK